MHPLNILEKPTEFDKHVNLKKNKKQKQKKNDQSKVCRK